MHIETGKRITQEMYEALSEAEKRQHVNIAPNQIEAMKRLKPETPHVAKQRHDGLDQERIEKAEQKRLKRQAKRIKEMS